MTKVAFKYVGTQGWSMSFKKTVGMCANKEIEVQIKQIQD
jgi:hypothetical protein